MTTQLITLSNLKKHEEEKARGVNRQTDRMNKKEGDGREDDAVDDDSPSALWVNSSLTQTHPGPMNVGGAEIPLSQRRGFFFSLSLSVSQVPNPKPDTLLS